MTWAILVQMVANIISVFFASKGSKLAWLFSLIGGLLMCWMLFDAKLYMTFGFNAYGVGAAVVGLMSWKTREDTISKICFGRTWLVAIIVLAIASIIYFVDNELNAQFPIFDCLGTALTSVATYLMVKKDINAWICFLVADAVYVTMGIVSGGLAGSEGLKWILIYGAMFTTATYGLVNFLRSYRKNRKAENQ